MILHIFKVLFTAVGDFVVVLIFHIVLQKNGLVNLRLTQTNKKILNYP